MNPNARNIIAVELRRLNLDDPDVKALVVLHNHMPYPVRVSGFALTAGLAHASFEDSNGNRWAFTSPTILPDPPPWNEDYSITVEVDEQQAHEVTLFEGVRLTLANTAADASNAAILEMPERLLFNLESTVSVLDDRTKSISTVPLLGKGITTVSTRRR